MKKGYAQKVLLSLPIIIHYIIILHDNFINF